VLNLLRPLWLPSLVLSFAAGVGLVVAGIAILKIAPA
jgi:hypothetical protein